MLNSLCTIHGNLYLSNVYNHAMKKVKSMPTLQPSDFEIIQLIGAGAFGKVYLVKKTPTAFIPQARGIEYFALKVLSLEDLKKKNKVRRFHQEYDIMLSLQHPYIIKLYGAFADERNYYILMEYCQYGDLYFWMKTQPNQRFSEKMAIQISAEILTAIEYVQYKGIIFRDLKPENVLIGQDGHIRLTDFDLSKRVAKEGSKIQYENNKLLISTKWDEEQPNTSIVGTIAYLAPEVFKGKHGQCVDYYTLGIFIYELIFGYTPFETISCTYDSVREKVLTAKLEFPKDIKVSENCKDLIRRLLEKNPEKRLGSKFGASEIKQHPWFKNYNWQIIYDTCFNIKEYSSKMKAPRKDQYEIMCKDLVGTKFILPQKTQILMPKYKKLYQINNQPVYPKPVDLNAQFFGMQEFYGDKKDGLCTIQAIKKGTNRLGTTELFQNKNKKPKVVNESDL